MKTKINLKGFHNKTYYLDCNADNKIKDRAEVSKKNRKYQAHK